MLISLLALSPGKIYNIKWVKHGSLYRGPITLLEPLVELVGNHKNAQKISKRKGEMGEMGSGARQENWVRMMCSNGFVRLGACAGMMPIIVIFSLQFLFQPIAQKYTPRPFRPTSPSISIKPACRINLSKKHKKQTKMNDFQCSCCNGSGGNPHNHDRTTITTSELTTHSLHQYITHENVRTYNSTNSISGSKILKHYKERYTPLPDCVEEWDSDDDPKDIDDEDDSEFGVIIFIPFNSGVKLTSVCVMTANNDENNLSTKNPLRLHLHPNIDDLDFASLSSSPPAAQIIQLVGTPGVFSETLGSIDYPVKQAKFNNCNCLSIHLTGNNPIRVSYIGLKGTGGILNARRAVECVYESKGVIGDGHKALNQGELGSYE